MASVVDPIASVQDQLRDLVTRGFRFLHPCADHGELVAVVGVRVHDRVIDVIEVRDESDAVATRMPDTEMDCLAPTNLLWHTSGRASSVLTELLSLPD